jgi:hypothetical protein
MRLNEISEKSRLVLKALAKGLSYEQLLATDRTLTSHDVFRRCPNLLQAFGAKGLPLRQMASIRMC